MSRPRSTSRPSKESDGRAQRRLRPMTPHNTVQSQSGGKAPGYPSSVSIVERRKAVDQAHIRGHSMGLLRGVRVTFTRLSVEWRPVSAPSRRRKSAVKKPTGRLHARAIARIWALRARMPFGSSSRANSCTEATDRPLESTSSRRVMLAYARAARIRAARLSCGRGRGRGDGVTLGVGNLTVLMWALSTRESSTA
jgi:hypothetical protein